MDLPGRVDELQCENVIRGRALGQAVRPPAVVGNVATDGARCLR